MKKLMTFLMLVLCSIQSAQALNVDAFMDKHIAPVSDFVANLIFFPISVCGEKVPIIIFWILIAGIFFTVYFRGIAIWGFKHAIDVIAKPAEKSKDGDSCGEVSSFQALATALSGTIGIGSIAGVAISISIGGPGAAFWIFAGAILGMSIKFVEATLAVKEAFTPTAVASGIFGTIITGLRRSVQSNEAGTGAAAIVYATSQTKEHVSQGFVALLETFLTGVLCLFTSFAIVITGVLKTSEVGKISGIELASNAFQSVISFFPIILSIIAILFAISTLISWAYYGQKAWTFLLGEGKKRVLTFNIIYCLFIIIGSAMNVKSIIDITDAMMIAMCVPNIIVLYILAPEVKKDLKQYCQKYGVGKLIYRKWFKEIKPQEEAIKLVK